MNAIAALFVTVLAVGPLAVIAVYFGAVLLAEMREARTLRQLRRIPLAWLFIFTAATCVGLAIRDYVAFPFGTLGCLVVYAIVRVFVIELLAGTKYGRGNAFVRRFVQRSRPTSIKKACATSKIDKCEDRPRLRLRLRLPRFTARNVWINFRR